MVAVANTPPTPINRASDMPETTPPAERTPQQVAELLRRPFAPHVVKQRRVGGGGTVNYVPIDTVVDRLNRACLTWDWEVVRIEVFTLPLKRNGAMVDTPVMHVTGRMTVPGLGSRSGVGTAPVDNEDAAKIAESDCLKRCASEFGVPGGR